MKKNKYFLYIQVIFFIIFFCFIESSANENAYFLTLKNSKVNLRQGPSFKYPIKLIYKKKYLPVIIIDKSEEFRKIKDFQNNSGWIHITQLSKKKAAINTKNRSILYKNPSIYSKPIAKLEIGRLVIVKKCKDQWCKISSGNFNGWILKNYLWGKI